MDFVLKFHPALKRDLKALPKHVRSTILNDYFPRLQKEPALGKPLTGPLASLYSQAITFAGAQYRIAYRIIESDSVVFVFMVGERESFYERLKQRLTTRERLP